MAGLPWLPASLAKETESWGWTSTVQSALGSLKDAGEQIMQPIGQQIASAMPTPPPMPMPEVKLPEAQPFTLPDLSSWGFGSPATPAAQPAQGRGSEQQQGQGFEMSPATTPDATVSRRPAAGPGGFQLPSLEAWGMGPTTVSGSQVPASQGTVNASPRLAPQRTQHPAPGTGSAATPGAIDNSSRQAFVRTAYPHMLAASGGNKDLAEMMLAAAISENGDVGKGGGFVGNNFFGIKGKGTAGSFNAATWEQEGGQRVNQNANFAAYNSPVEGFAAFRQFLTDNPRYAPALQRFEQTQNAEELFQNINRAGYATDTNWGSTIANIRRNQVAPVTKGLEAAPPQPLTNVDQRPSTAVNGPAGAPTWGTYTPETLTPNQDTEGRAQGLSAAEALAICGPAAAVAFAQSAGRQPTLREAKELASKLGLWNVDQGMAGPASQVKLLDNMGINARLEQGADEAAIAREIAAGRPVTIDTPQHYYVATGYDPQTRQFEFGQSAGVLRASKGRTRYRLDELPSLGMGSPRASIFFLGTK